MKVSFRLRGCLVAVLSLCASSCDPVRDTAESPQKWRFALEEPLGSVQHEYALKFKELIEAKSDGRITVTIYPYGTLGTSDQITEQLRMGAVQFAMASPGHLGKLIPEVQVFLLHFVLSDDERVNRSILSDPEIADAIDALYAEKGMRFLSAFSEGWQVWTTRKPIREPEDFRGVKMRVMTSPLLLAAYAAYGASPTPLPYSEVYSALQLNMIDGQVNPVFAIQEMSFHEVTDWMIFPNHAPFVTTAVTDREFFEGLPAESRRMIRDAVAELHEYIFEVQRDFNADRLAVIREQKSGLRVVTLTDEERGRFRRASLPVRNRYVELAGSRGERLLGLLRAAVDRQEEALSTTASHGLPQDASDRPPGEFVRAAADECAEQALRPAAGPTAAHPPVLLHGGEGI